jgi:hypothetical protein
MSIDGSGSRLSRAAQRILATNRSSPSMVSMSRMREAFVVFVGIQVTAL